ncbi:hypothetical protein EJB05_30265 [Eragrostis curvula]|uniref:Uncharacterized protein n=1 Tax=Eragrostis curvula TaxID=38414 RepID=A0A5J9UIX9_9POAL|nr:hypothetical protein EJB05_30265 [Eragrostis curvula]
MAARSHGPVRHRPEELIAGPFSSESTESLTRSSSPVKHALRRTSLLAPVSRPSWWNRAKCLLHFTDDAACRIVALAMVVVVAS